MNTQPEVASAQLFVRVLQDSLLSHQAGATDLIIPRCDLTELWTTAVARQARVVFGAHIDQVTVVGDPLQTGQVTQVQIQDEQFDGCIVATPPAVTIKLARTWPGEHAQQLRQTLEQFEFLPITTCYVELDRPLSLTFPMMLLSSGHGHNATGLGQWVFDRNFILNTGSDQHQTARSQPAKLAFVISHAGQQMLDRQTLAQELVEQLWHEQSSATGANKTSQTAPRVVHSRIITEKRATFAATPGLSRPSIHSPWPHIKLAGDWTDTNYPAVLEGAVISGMAAARSLLDTYKLRNH